MGCEVETGVGGTAEEIRSGRPVQCVGLKQSRHCRKREIWKHVKPGKSTPESSGFPDTSCFCNQLYFDMQIPYMALFATKLHPWTLPSVELKRQEEELSQGLPGTQAAAGRSKNKTQVPLLALRGLVPSVE